MIKDYETLVDYVPVKGEIIWYLSLTAWLISLRIMLSSSIHAATKEKKQTKCNQRHLSYEQSDNSQRGEGKG